MSFTLPPFKVVDTAASLVNPYVHRTPVLTSTALNAKAETSIFFKCENFQKMGAFKMRGAIHAILQLSEASIDLLAQQRPGAKVKFKLLAPTF